jgi:hypothetical protein
VPACCRFTCAGIEALGQSPRLRATSRIRITNRGYFQVTGRTPPRPQPSSFRARVNPGQLAWQISSVRPSKDTATRGNGNLPKLTSAEWDARARGRRKALPQRRGKPTFRGTPGSSRPRLPDTLLDFIRFVTAYQAISTSNCAQADSSIRSWTGCSEERIPREQSAERLDSFVSFRSDRTVAPLSGRRRQRPQALLCAAILHNWVWPLTCVRRSARRSLHARLDGWASCNHHPR